MDHALDDRELVLRFESLGDNCELGLVQRQAGAEPLGLLRFSGTPLRSLLRGLATRFEGIADPAQIRVYEENGEYMVKLTKYDVYYHTHIQASETTPEAVHEKQSRSVNFLISKLIGDLEHPRKILVFRQNEPLMAGDLTDLRIALSAYGPGILLWVREACPGHPSGTVNVVDERLMIGYLRSLAPREDVPRLDMASWLGVLRRAHALSLLPGDARMAAARAAAARLGRTHLTFGLGGNAAELLGYGWSGPEEGYQWSIGERSLLTMANPGRGEDYWLEMQVTPYVVSPVVPVQRLDVLVNGTLVKRFDPVARGTIGCVVPGHLVGDRENVEIVLDHPNAASPMAAEGMGDDRLLALSFVSLTLICAA